MLPVFQRPYVWKEEEQWVPLWDDIQETADRVYAHNEHGSDSPKTHFLGAVVLSASHVRATGQRERRGGRPAAAHDAAGAPSRHARRRPGSGDEGLDRDFHRLTLNSCRMTRRSNGSRCGRRRQIGQRSGTSSRRRALRNQSAVPPRPAEVAAEPGTSPQAGRGLPILPRADRELLDGDEDESSEPVVSRRLDALLDALTKYMELVVIELEADDDPQVIFESLNGRGAPLLPSISSATSCSSKRRGGTGPTSKHSTSGRGHGTT